MKERRRKGGKVIENKLKKLFNLPRIQNQSKMNKLTYLIGN